MRKETLQITEISFSELQLLFRQEIEPLLSILQQQPKPATEQAEPEKLLTAEQAAELLSLTVRTIYDLSRQGQLPSCKRGKRLYFSSTELINWVKQTKRKTRAEIQQAAETYLNKKGGSK